MDSTCRLFLDRQQPQHAERLWELIASLQGDDRLAPVTVVGPSVYANLSLRLDLARSGFANVRFLVLPRVAELLGAPGLSARGRQPLTPVTEGAAIRACLGGTSGLLSDVRNNPGTVRSLRSTFRELRGASASALEFLSRQGGLRSEVVALYRRYRENTARFYDREDLALSAGEAVLGENAPGLADLGHIVFFHPNDLTSAETALIDALAIAGRCTVILGLIGEADADRPITAIFDRLRPSLGDAVVGPAGPVSTETEILVAPDPHEEIRWVIRRIVQRAEAGVPFHRMAVLYRKPAPYASLIRQELELAGLPVAGPDNGSLATTAVGRSVTGLLRLADGELSRDSLMSWLTGCPVSPPGADASSFLPSRWDAISKKAGVVQGLEQWSQRLLTYAEAQERSADAGETQAEVTEARAGGMRSEARAARDLRAFVLDLADAVARPPDGSSWEEFSDWANGLLRRYVALTADSPESEQLALDAIGDRVKELAAVQTIDPSPSFEEFRLALDELLTAPLGHVGTTGQGVFVAPIGAAMAMGFDSLFVVGMIEGSVPPATRDDPLVPDADRLAAGGVASGMSARSEYATRERYEFLSAMAMTPRRVLSYPVAEPARGRANYPSRWLLEQASMLEGARVSTTTLGSLGERHWLTVIPSPERALATVSTSSAADSYDYELERLWQWTKDGGRTGQHPFVRSGSLARSLEMGRSRNSGSLTEWDGNLSEAGGAVQRRRRLGASAHSPTSLERWARCPFSYFLGSVLRIGALETPEDAYSISPLERGSLVHNILERFVLDVDRDGTMPRPGEDWNEGHLEKLRRISEEEFEGIASIGTAGKPIMWELDRQEILGDLETFLERDSQIRTRYGTSPSHVEARFGFEDGASYEAAITLDDGIEIRFRGMIDRVDTSGDGRRAMVYDYKTGSNSPYRDLENDPFDKGRRLQLPVYSLAVRQMLGSDVAVSAAYWFVTTRGGFSFRPSEPRAFDSPEDREGFAEVVRTIVSGIGDGVFPANPGKPAMGGFENCRYCDFDSLCPSRRDALWQRKRSDPTVAGYVELSADDSP